MMENRDLVISTNRAVAITGDLEVSGFTQLGSGGPYIKTKRVGFKMSGSVSTLTTANHGINDYKNIIQWSATVRDDGGQRYYNPVYYGTGLFYASIDSTTCRAETSASGTALLGDSVFFYITYRGSY